MSTLLLEMVDEEERERDRSLDRTTRRDGEDVRRSGDYSGTGSDVEHPAGNSCRYYEPARREGVSDDKSLYTASAPWKATRDDQESSAKQQTALCPRKSSTVVYFLVQLGLQSPVLQEPSEDKTVTW